MGEGGFEPPATWFRTKYHTKLDHPPLIYDALEEFIVILILDKNSIITINICMLILLNLLLLILHYKNIID